MTELVGLADRCEAATGRDWHLEQDIAQAVGYASDCSQPFTSSVDAALTLVPDRCEWSFDAHNNIAFVYEYYSGNNGPDCCAYEAEASTPALALCAAALRARAGQSS